MACCYRNPSNSSSFVYDRFFHRIDHNILLYKLNVPPILLKKCTNFLQHRHQRVKLRSSISSWKPIHSGVPQGTKLGPLFFLMVNDLCSDLLMYKYVDDCTIFEVTPISSEPSAQQDELDRISKWTIDNNMKLNIYIAKVLCIFLKEPRLSCAFVCQ